MALAGGEADAAGVRVLVAAHQYPRRHAGGGAKDDDEPTVRMLVTNILDDSGHSAIEAGDGAAGLKVLFITADAKNAILGNGHLAPGMAVLTKPFPVQTMAARIRSRLTVLENAIKIYESAAEGLSQKGMEGEVHGVWLD